MMTTTIALIFATITMNAICTVLLVYGGYQNLKMARLNLKLTQSLAEWSNRFAQGIETRSAVDAKRRGPEGESPVVATSDDAPNL